MIRQIFLGALGALFFFGCGVRDEVPELEPDLPSFDTVVSEQQVRRLSDAQFLIHVYEVALARKPDPVGFDHHLRLLRQNHERRDVFAGLLASGEVANNPALQDRAGFVRRTYRVLLERDADSGGAAAWAATMRPWGASAATSWFGVFQGILFSHEYASKRRPMAGVHFPIPVRPRVSLTSVDFVRIAYQVVLGRRFDRDGLHHHVAMAEGAGGRAGVYESLTGSREFQSRGALADRAGYVRRLYGTVLERSPPAAEIAGWVGLLRSYDNNGAGYTWLEALDAFVHSAEYRARHCHDEYWSYGGPIDFNEPVLNDVMADRAALPQVGDAEKIALEFPAGGQVTHVWDQKLAFIPDEPDGLRHAFTRGWNHDTQTFNIYLMRQKSSGSGDMQQVGGALFEKDDHTHFYDPHVAVDYSVCPRRYVMVTECAIPELAAHVPACVSYTTTPTAHVSWSKPAMIVRGCSPGTGGCDRYRSSSTPTVLFDHHEAYVAWTEVDDQAVWAQDEGQERTSTGVVGMQSVYNGDWVWVRDGASPFAMEAERDIHCTNAWDCNNRDAQDWKTEGVHHYFIYNGGDYYRCLREEGDNDTIKWANSLVRSQSPAGVYRDFLAPESRVQAQRDDICGTSYPTVNRIGSRLYMYYAHYDVEGGNSTRRGLIRWR